MRKLVDAILADSLPDGSFVRLVRGSRGSCLAFCQLGREDRYIYWLLGVVSGLGNCSEFELARAGAAGLALALGAHVLHGSPVTSSGFHGCNYSVRDCGRYRCVVANGASPSDGAGDFNISPDIFQAALERDLWTR